MQDDNIKLSEAGIESMNLISTNDDNIDAEYAAEINEWESKPILTRAASTVSRVGVTPIRRTCEYNFPPFFCTALQFPTAYIPDG